MGQEKEMKRSSFLVVLLSIGVLLGQNPNTAAWPGAIATDTDLLVASDRVRTTLSSGINNSTLTIPVASAGSLVVPASITVGACTGSGDCEHIKICSKDGNTLTACSGGRGFSGTSAISHSSGEQVTGTITSYVLNQIGAELKAVETSLSALRVIRTSATQLTILGGIARFGSTSYVLASATATITAGTGTAYIYVSSAGALTVASGLTITCSGCTATSGSSFPTDSVPLATWTATSVVWDVGGETDYRASLSTKKIVGGSGISVTEASGHATVAVDSSVDPYAKKFWIQAVNCDGTTASLNWDTLATLKPTAACTAGTTNTGLMRGLASFSNSEISQMQVHFSLPSTWGGAIDLKFRWQTSATTGSVVWQAATMCVADGEVDDAAWNTASTVTDAAKGTTLQVNEATITGLTVTGCSAGELLHLKVFRDPDHANDDLAATADLKGVEVSLRAQ